MAGTMIGEQEKTCTGENVKMCDKVSHEERYPSVHAIVWGA